MPWKFRSSLFAILTKATDSLKEHHKVYPARIVQIIAHKMEGGKLEMHSLHSVPKSDSLYEL